MSWSEMSPYVKHVAHRELTEKQHRVLVDTINGHSIRTIARALGVSDATVRTHLERALAKMAPYINQKERV